MPDVCAPFAVLLAMRLSAPYQQVFALATDAAGAIVEATATNALRSLIGTL